MTAASRCAKFHHRALRSVRQSLAADLQRYLNKSPENQAAGNTFKARLSARLTPEFMALALYRLSHYLHVNGWRRCAGLAAALNRGLHRVNIAPESCIGPGFHLPHPAGVTFLGSAGEGLTLYSLAVCCSLPPGEVRRGTPSLGDRVTLGAHAVVLGPVIVGNGCKIAYSVRVVEDLPEYHLAVSTALRQGRMARAAGGGD